MYGGKEDVVRKKVMTEKRKTKKKLKILTFVVGSQSFRYKSQ